MCFTAFFFCLALSSSFELRSTYSRNPVSWQHVDNVVLPLTLAGRIVNAPEVRQLNTYPLLSSAWETLHVATEYIITQFYQAVKKFIETEHS